MDMKITNLRKFIKYNKDVFVDGYKFGKATATMDSTLLIRILNEWSCKVVQWRIFHLY